MRTPRDERSDERSEAAPLLPNQQSANNRRRDDYCPTPEESARAYAAEQAERAKPMGSAMFGLAVGASVFFVASIINLGFGIAHRDFSVMPKELMHMMGIAQQNAVVAYIGGAALASTAVGSVGGLFHRCCQKKPDVAPPRVVTPTIA